MELLNRDYKKTNTLTQDLAGKVSDLEQRLKQYIDKKIMREYKDELTEQKDRIPTTIWDVALIETENTALGSILKLIDDRLRKHNTKIWSLVLMSGVAAVFLPPAAAPVLWMALAVLAGILVGGVMLLFSFAKQLCSSASELKEREAQKQAIQGKIGVIGSLLSDISEGSSAESSTRSSSVAGSYCGSGTSSEGSTSRRPAPATSFLSGVQSIESELSDVAPEGGGELEPN